MKTLLSSLLLGLACCVSVRAQPVFTRVTDGPLAADTAHSNGASWADYDGDGDRDLFVTNGWWGGRVEANALYRNHGDGTFERVTDSPLVARRLFHVGSTWADADNDGDLDVFVAVADTALGSLLFLNDGRGGFTEVAGIGGAPVRGWSPAWGDYDNDGLVDLVVTHPAGFVGAPVASNALFHNEGRKAGAGPGGVAFTPVIDTPVTADTAAFTIASWADYDRDGDLDLFMGSGPANGTKARDFLYRNRGDGTFERITEGPIATDERDGQVMNWVDYDNDGDLDLFVTNWGGAPQGSPGLPDQLYRNDAGRYTPVTEGALVTDSTVSLSNTWGDYDNDGDLDVFVATGGRQPNRLFVNDGQGTFTKVEAGALVADPSNSWGAATADVDDDGDLDLYVSNTGRAFANFFFRNDTPAGNHWLKLRLAGTRSNRAGIGANVRVRARIGERTVWQQRAVSAQDTFNGHNAFDVHFGLGDAARVERVEVAWPSGLVDVFEGVAADQTLTVREGAASGSKAAGQP